MYAKIFSQIFDSSIADSYQLRHFFMDLLVLADCEGRVDMTPSAIAARTRIPLSDVMSMLETLEHPDPHSRSPECEGRRLVKLDEHRQWGWLIVNYAHYRDCKSESDKRAKTTERVRRYRQRQRELAPSEAPEGSESGSESSECNALQALHSVTSVSVSVSASGKGGVGETPCNALQTSPEPQVAPKSPKRELTDLWCSEWAKAHGGQRYAFAGARDGKAADRLIALGIPISDILAIARAAWGHSTRFWCKQAVSLAGFAGRFNEIRQEVMNDPEMKPKEEEPAWYRGSNLDKLDEMYEGRAANV